MAPPPAERIEPEAHRRLHERAGWLALVGGLGALLAYALPWIVASSQTGSSVTISGYRVLDTPSLVLGLGYAIVLIGAAGFYLSGRREGSPRLLMSLGIGSLMLQALHYPGTLDSVGSLRSALQARGLDVTVSIGFGVWVEFAGGFLIVVAGIYASRLLKLPKSGTIAESTPGSAKQR